MSWQNEMVTILRGLIDDIDASTYTKGQLEQMLLIAAIGVKVDVDLAITYTINVSDEILTPDPTDGVRDDAFINLTCLKAAHIILRNEAKVKGNESVSFSDGPSRISLESRYKALKELADKMCEEYEQAKIDYALGVNIPGQAVVGPIVQANIQTIRGNM